jgi:myo-inositol catabolism protein IolS
VWRVLKTARYEQSAGLPSGPIEISTTVARMPYRRLGRSGLTVSEVGFGAWAIGGRAYGAVERNESLRALARAEELGCNLVDTASMYGNSEEVLGEFLRGRRQRWIIATKYSYQPAGMTKTVEEQLRRLGTDVIDFYQLHWLPPDARVYEELTQLKRAGKVRFIGASVYSARDVERVMRLRTMDGVQLPLSLLDPDPFLRAVMKLRESGLAVLVRSTLKEGFLTGKFRRGERFADPADQRHKWSARRVARTVERAERFRFLEATSASMLQAAVAYPLSFPEVSSVLLGTKTTRQAQANFGEIPGGRLSREDLVRVLALQDELDAGNRRGWRAIVRRMLGRG